MIKNYISKEVFKTYYNNCSKVALLMSNINILKNFITSLKNNDFAILNLNLASDKVSLSEEDDSALAPIDPIESFIELFESLEDDSAKESLNFLYSFKEKNMNNGFDVINFTNVANTILDGEKFGSIVREYFEILNQKFNLSTSNKGKCFNFNSDDFQTALNKTKKILEEKKEYGFIFEGAFQFENVLRVRPDVLQVLEDGRVSIFEAKASTYREEDDKNKIKKEHLLDLFYQAYVIEKLGYVVADMGLCLINGNYSLNTNAKDNDFYEKANKYKEIVNDNVIIYTTELEEEIKKIIEAPIPKPDKPEDVDPEGMVSIVRWDDKNNKIMDIYQYFKDDMDEMFLEIDLHIQACLENKNIDFLNMIEIGLEKCKIFSRNRKDLKYQIKNKVCSFLMPSKLDVEPNIFWVLSPNTGIEFCERYGYLDLIDEMPIDLIEKAAKFNKTSSLFFNDIKKQKIEIIKKYFKNKCKIDDDELIISNPAAFSQLIDVYKETPIYLYDFETAMWAVPEFNFQNPYDQTVFQYSIHIIENESDLIKENYDKKHLAWLKKEREDPRMEFIHNFIKDAFSKGPGLYVAYNKSFEIGVLRKLAANFPQYKNPLLYIASKTVDLWDFFSKNHIYHPKFKRSTSIKYTQPALYPELQYKDLIINNGLKASYMFRQYIDDLLGSDSEGMWKNVYYNHMLNYCNRDTEAMVVLFKRILEIWNKYKTKRNEESNWIV